MVSTQLCKKHELGRGPRAAGGHPNIRSTRRLYRDQLLGHACTVTTRRHPRIRALGHRKVRAWCHLKRASLNQKRSQVVRFDCAAAIAGNNTYDQDVHDRPTWTTSRRQARGPAVGQQSKRSHVSHAVPRVPGRSVRLLPPWRRCRVFACLGVPPRA